MFTPASRLAPDNMIRHSSVHLPGLRSVAALSMFRQELHDSRKLKEYVAGRPKKVPQD
jgi:hypothetical protein